ncbi:MAG: VanZ family protein [Clostridia bacterium]|nr:VanZ family protein [Clostridia bacterium]
MLTVKDLFKRKGTLICLLAYILLTAFIFYSSLKSGNASSRQSGTVATLISNAIEFLTFDTVVLKEQQWYLTCVRKVIGHFSLFFTLAIFAFVVYYRLAEKLKPSKKLSLGTALSITAGILTAGISELLQSEIFVEGRAPEFSDVLLDSLGYLLATLILLFIYHIRKRKKEKIRNDNVD